MTKLSQTALAALLGFTLTPSAQAQAWTQLDVTGSISFSHLLDSSGSFFGGHALPYTVRRGESATLTLNYNLQASDSGQPVTLSGAELDSYNACNPILFLVSCPPPLTPYESAFVRIGYDIPHDWLPPFVNIRGTGAPGDLGTQRGAEADSVSQSGTWTFDVSMDNWGPLTEYSGVIPIISSQWVVTSPIPEPATYALMMTGLVAAWTRRRTIPKLSRTVTC